MSPNTIDLRRAAIRYLPSTADCPFADRRCQCLGTIADIRSDAATKRQSPEKKVAASAAITPQLLAPIPDDLRGKHDRSLPLVVLPAPCVARSLLPSAATG